MKAALAYDEPAVDEELRRRSTVLRRPAGRRRDSSIVGIFNDALRHKDGALTVAYEVEMPATMFAEDAVIDDRYDEMARLLAFDKPAGTLIQFRYASIPDSGQAIARVLSSRAPTGTHTLASLLQASNLDYVKGVARDLPYRQTVLTMWVRIPPLQRASSTVIALAEFKSALRSEIKANGFASALRQMPVLYTSTADDSVIRHALEDEKRAYACANTIWRQIENSSPLGLRRFNRQEIWEAVYFGQCQNATSAPLLPDRPGRDLRDYLCAERIEGDLIYLMHGNYPIAIVSLFTPPHECVTADALRSLIARRDFNTRHTIVTEYLFPEQRKETKRLDRRIRQVKRTFTRRDNPEGAERRCVVCVRYVIKSQAPENRYCPHASM